MNKEAKTRALETLKGNWGYAIIAALVYSILMSIVTVAGGIGGLLLGSVLLIGYINILIGAKVTGKFELEKIIDGFKSGLMDRILLSIVKTLFIFLWSLLLIIPGIIKSYSWKLAEYISRENPEKTYKECMDESANLMKGKKMDMFKFHLSFIGWFLLCFLTFGIGVLWLVPYMKQAEIEFIDKNIMPIK